jgi:hypothetical protein
VVALASGDVERWGDGGASVLLVEDERSAGLRLTGPASSDAASKHARLLTTLRDAQAPHALV